MVDRLDEVHEASENRFVWILAAIVVFVAAIPALFAILSAPAGGSYVGFQYNTDDHMVYAAWMRQAMDGHLFFDNRFTTQDQPGLTVHLYFFVLGLVAKVTGIPLAAALGRLGFSVLFIWLLYRLIRRLDWQVYTTKLALALTVVGGGLGFFVWHNFGQAIVLPSPLSSLMLDRLPTDVWQPEAFVFPSMLTNGLFMVSLCLILAAFLSFLNARTQPKSMLTGAVAIGLLMNIHSYDVLLVALVMVGFLGASFMRKLVTAAWVGRSAVIACGAILPAAWFVHVLQNDPVFQSRAATETYSPNFRQVFFGYIFLMALALYGAWNKESDASTQKRRRIGIGLVAGLYLTLFVLAAGHTDKYFLTMPGFVAVFAVAFAAVVLASDESPTWNLLFSWAVIGTIAIYLPQLFQRKLAMGLSIPWAILASYGFYVIVKGRERSARNLALALAIIILGASSVRWLFREIVFIRTNVANTSRHPVYLTQDMRSIIDYLNKQTGKNVVLALPGSANPAVDTDGKPIPDDNQSPILPDLAPFCSGLAGVYTYAGHWSETPAYEEKCGEMYRFFFREPFGSVHRVMTDDERLAFSHTNKATYAVLPTQESYPELPLVAPATLGTVVVEGSQFQLVKLK